MGEAFSICLEHTSTQKTLSPTHTWQNIYLCVVPLRRSRCHRFLPLQLPSMPPPLASPPSAGSAAPSPSPSPTGGRGGGSDAEANRGAGLRSARTTFFSQAAAASSFPPARPPPRGPPPPPHSLSWPVAAPPPAVAGPPHLRNSHGRPHPRRVKENLTAANNTEFDGPNRCDAAWAAPPSTAVDGSATGGVAQPLPHVLLRR